MHSRIFLSSRLEKIVCSWTNTVSFEQMVKHHNRAMFLIQLDLTENASDTNSKNADCVHKLEKLAANI